MEDMAQDRMKTPPLRVDWLLAKTLDHVPHILQVSHVRGKNLLLVGLLVVAFLNRGGSLTCGVRDSFFKCFRFLCRGRERENTSSCRLEKDQHNRLIEQKVQACQRWYGWSK